MYKGVIEYKGELLAPNSYAAELFHAKKWAELDAHMKQLNKEYYKWRTKE